MGASSRYEPAICLRAACSGRQDAAADAGNKTAADTGGRRQCAPVMAASWPGAQPFQSALRMQSSLGSPC